MFCFVVGGDHLAENIFECIILTEKVKFELKFYSSLFQMSDWQWINTSAGESLGPRWQTISWIIIDHWSDIASHFILFSILFNIVHSGQVMKISMTEIHLTP